MRVSLLSCQQVFVCRTCLGLNCSVMEKVEFRGGGDVLEDVEKFCYLSGMLVPMVEHLNSDYKNR